jgi:phosphoribosylcarboxyaminoimidazole (NCAIR) mutase
MLIVDAANVIGSIPDGWWRDRAGAVRRLRDALAAADLPDEVVLVVEGAARGVEPVLGVRVESAPRSGDDAIVELIEALPRDTPVTVVTADRGLRQRVGALGAATEGPRTLRERIGYGNSEMG